MVQEEDSFEQCPNIQTFYRFLPEPNIKWDYVRMLDNKKTVYLRCLQDLEKGMENREPSYWKFDTDGLFYNAPQDMIYNNIIGPGFYDRLLEGNNGAIFVYGQTCSGKSVTAFGLENNFEDRGVVMRVAETLFSLKKSLAKQFKISISLSYVETNRLYVNDLLCDKGKCSGLLDGNSMKNVVVLRAKSLYAALKMLFKGEARKTIRDNNYRSNMANCIVTFYICKVVKATKESYISKLHIVDMCGADTVGNYSCHHKHGLEVGVGNLTKTLLEEFLLVVASNSRDMLIAKQRMCVTVKYLKDALHKKALLRFVGHLRRSVDYLKISLSMLRFGQLLTGIVTEKLHPQMFLTEEAKHAALLGAYSNMKREMDLNAMIRNEDRSVTMTQERMECVAKLAHDYLSDKNGEIVLLNTTDTIIAMKVLKEFYCKVNEEKNEVLDQMKAQELQILALQQAQELPKSPSKTSKRGHTSVTSFASLTKTKRSSKQRLSKELDRSSMQGSRIISKTASGSIKQSRNGKRKSGRRTSKDSSMVISGQSSSVIKPSVPDIIPDYENAWTEFIELPETDYSRYEFEQASFDKEIIQLTGAYNQAVHNLRECQDVLNIRQEEAYKASLFKDLSPREATSNTSLSFIDIEQICAENLMSAQTEVVQQKEKVLILQAQLKLIIETKRNLKLDLEKKYADYCLAKYNVLIPNLAESLNILQCPPSEPIEADPPVSLAVEESVFTESKNQVPEEVQQFDYLQKYLQKEIESWNHRKWRNKKWIHSCKVITHI